MNKISLIPFAVISVFVFWLIDTLANIYFFKISTDFLDSFFTPTQTELWTRFLVTAAIILFSIYTRKQQSTLENKLEEKQDEADELKYLETTDPITLLSNKRKIHELLDYEMEKDKRYKLGLAVIFCDIDSSNIIAPVLSQDFLRAFALQLVTTLRKSDVVSRWGEEGFLILIPNKSAVETKVIIEKIQNAIQAYDFPETGKITISFGATQYQEGDNKVTIVERAESAFKKAKTQGASSIEITA